MLELDKKVFGKITTKEIIGAQPPADKTKIILENELSSLISNLASKSNEDLKKILDEQEICNAHVNSRPGAMALAQAKIKLFNEYSSKYAQAIKEKIEA